MTASTEAAPAARSTVAPACANCQAALAGPFCHACGQEARAPARGGDLRRVLAELLSVDGKAVRTLATLVARPGRLTRDYVDGRRVRWTQPAQVYLLVVTLFFLVNAYRPFISFDPQTSHVVSSLGTVAVGETFTPAQLARRIPPGTSADAYRERFEAAASGYLSTFLVGTAALFALALKVLHRRRAMGVHVVFALHWTAFYMLLMVFDRMIPGVQHGRSVAGVAIVAVGTVYLWAALRTVYDTRWWVAALQAVGLKLAFYLALVAWMASAIAVALAFA